MKTLSILILFILIYGVQIISAQTDEVSCSIQAYVTDKDPKGLNIRDKPSVNGKIIGKLKYSEDDGNLVMVTIIGYSNGWVKISQAETVSGENQFSGEGWVSAKMVSTRTERADQKPLKIYAKPNIKSKTVGTMPNDIQVKIVGFDCFGLKVTYKKMTGWIPKDDLCGNPVTTCP